MVHLRFSHNNKSIYTVPIEMVLPLTGGDSQDEDFEGVSNDQDLDDDDDSADFVPEQILDRIPGLLTILWMKMIHPSSHSVPHFL